MLSQGAYGPKVAVPLILNLLEQFSLQATFFVPGWIVEHYPKTIEAIHRGGHEIGHHGYKHEWPDSDHPEIEKEVLNCITCAFFSYRSDDVKVTSLKDKTPISVQFVTKDLFSSGKWVRVSNEAISLAEVLLPYRETKETGWVGAKVIGSGIVAMFLAAYYGNRDWNEMKDPHYYQNLLLPGVQRA